MTAGRHHRKDRTTSAHSVPTQRRPRRAALLLCGATVASGAVMLLSAVGATASADPKVDSDSVTLCHSTSSQVNPYNLITVDAAGAFDGHLGHVGDVWHSGIDKKPGWGDIIPPFTYKGVEYSLNWPDGEASFDNDCAIPPAPPTTATATAKVTNTATVTDTATVTNTATVTATETTTAPPVTETVTATQPVTETVTATETTTAPPVTETVTSTETVTNTETAPAVTETSTVTAPPVTETVTTTQPVTETVTAPGSTETVTETVPAADTSTATSGESSTSAAAATSSGAAGVSASQTSSGSEVAA